MFVANAAVSDAQSNGSSRDISEAEPLLFTNEALALSADSYDDLRAYFEANLADAACLRLRVAAPPRSVTEEQVRTFIRATNQALATSLPGEALKSLTLSSFSVDGALAPGRKVNRVAARDLVRKHAKSPDGDPDEILVELLSGTLARGAAVVVRGDRPVLLLGESLVRDGQTNYLIHLLANLTGLKPVWGGGERCGDDGIGDTPPHSGANYDCNLNHRSSCRSNWELDANMMDARACEGPMTWTPKQRAYVTPYFELGQGVEPCRTDPAMQDAAGGEGCGFAVTPNPVRASGGCDLTIRWAHAPTSNRVRVLVTHPGGVAASERFERADLADGEVTVSMCHQPPGAYTITVTADESTCSKLLVISDQE